MHTRTYLLTVEEDNPCPLGPFFPQKSWWYDLTRTVDSDCLNRDPGKLTLRKCTGWGLVGIPCRLVWPPNLPSGQVMSSSKLNGAFTGGQHLSSRAKFWPLWCQSSANGGHFRHSNPINLYISTKWLLSGHSERNQDQFISKTQRVWITSLMHIVSTIKTVHWYMFSSVFWTSKHMYDDKYHSYCY